jgi:hypothetical protein
MLQHRNNSWLVSTDVVPRNIINHAMAGSARSRDSGTRARLPLCQSIIPLLIDPVTQDALTHEAQACGWCDVGAGDDRRNISKRQTLDADQTRGLQPCFRAG